MNLILEQKGLEVKEVRGAAGKKMSF